MSSTGEVLNHKMHMASKFVEGHIKLQEAVLGSVRDLISEKGETTEEVQSVINQALDELEGWYEMRRMFE